MSTSITHHHKETPTTTDPHPANGPTHHSDRHAAPLLPGRDTPPIQPSNHLPVSNGVTVPNRPTSSNPSSFDPESATAEELLTYAASIRRSGSANEYQHLLGPRLLARTARWAADDAEVAWISEFQRCMARRLRGTASYDTIDEVIGREMLKVHEHFARIGHRWTAARYAQHRAAGARAIIDMLRTDGAQRGEGARHTRTVEALDAAFALVDSGDADYTLHDLYGSDDSGYADVDARDLLTAALLGLTPRQREVVYLVDGIGHPVTDVAASLGITRETASRALSVARRRLVDALAD